ncbi:hypothetical protein JRQ81_014753 [Phrynocephalus forsythii]|uniref:Nucleoside-diphosphate kinase n=1 Tax=Phrynocephalus forsythii TaxID=171643 RepID=A0A9Q0XZX2_9SAUR|nr:hypothetical protein JRQ81_014753 [Phrynocephalus forsythii]
MTTCDAKEYLAKREIPQLFESLLNGLMCYKPDDPVEYLEGCLQKVKELGGAEKVKWDTFVSPEKRTLPPLNGSQSRRAFFRNVMPDNPNFPYRRYERLPPIQQFSIESDTDLSETAELIEEYDVFDPARPRPKIILVIGHAVPEVISSSPDGPLGLGEEKLEDKRDAIYLLGAETTITEIKQRLMQIPDEEGIVIDGFPRDVAQALSFEDQICTPDLVVFLSCSNQHLKERLMKRAEQQGRPDDNLKATQRRFTNFKQNAVPLVKYFQEKGLIMIFDADRDEEEVFRDISAAVDNKLFPPQEPVAGPRELGLNIMEPPEDFADNEFDFEDQAYDQSCLCGPANVEDFSEDLKKSHIFFLVGGPGCGKGTLCEKLAQKYEFQHLSTEELIRHEMSSLTERSKTIRDAMETGKLVPGEVVLELLKEALFANAGDTKGFLLDGFPQDLKQGEEFESQIGEPSLVLCLDCSSATMSRRLQESQSSPSLEDRAEAITKRIEAYYQATEPVLTYYENRIPLFKVNAEGTPEEVFLETCAVIDAFLKKEETGSPLLADTI